MLINGLLLRLTDHTPNTDYKTHTWANW